MGTLSKRAITKSHVLDFGELDPALKGFKVTFRDGNRDDLKHCLGKQGEGLNSVESNDKYARRIRLTWEGLTPEMLEALAPGAFDVAAVREDCLEYLRSSGQVLREGEPIYLPCNDGNWDDLMRLASRFADAVSRFAGKLFDASVAKFHAEDARGNA
jgi:hypothetical protein